MSPGATVRQQIHALLRRGPASAKDVSREVGIPERDVAGHLEHLARSLRRSGGALSVTPAACLDCDFVFGDRDRHRFTRPGRCPRCHGRRLTLPRFEVR